MSIRYSQYEAVAESETYKALNRHLIELADGPRDAPFVDVGCGTGALSAILLEAGYPTNSVAVDPDPGMAAAAADLLPEGMTVLQLGAGDLRDRFAANGFGTVVMGNCVHLFDDVAAAFADAAAILRLDGVLAFNSSFYTGAARVEDLVHYRRLILSADRMLRSAGRSAEHVRPLAKRQLDLEFYATCLADAGFAISTTDEVAVCLDRELISLIVGNPAFASGALPRRDPELAAAALKKSVDDYFDAHPGLLIERRWINIVARRSEK